MQDFRFALRQLRQSPGFTALALITLMLGIGACTAIFSVVHGVVLRPLAYPQPERLVVIRETQLPQFPQFSLSPPNFADFHKAQSFEAMAAVRGQNFVLTGAGEPIRLGGAKVTGDYFRVYGTPALRGRWLLPEDDAPGKENVVVLTYALWQNQFGGAEDIIGRRVVLNGSAHTIVGVMPADWRRGTQAGIYAPMAFPGGELANDNRGAHYLGCIARLKAGVSLKQADADLKTIAAQLAQQYPDSNKGWGVFARDMLEDTVGAVNNTLFVLLGAVALVLVVACANIANLQLARATDRTREFAVRAALGAPRSRLIRLLLAESLTLAGIGGAAGIALAYGGLKLLLAIAPANLPRLAEIRLDPTVLLVSVVVSLCTGVLFGLLPALQAARTNLVDSLKDGARGSGQRRPWLRHALVVAEVALCLVLVTGAGLLARSFGHLREVDYGYNPENVTVVTVPLTGLQQAGEKASPAVDFSKAVMEKFRALPGVTHVGGNHSLPFLNDWILGFAIEGRPTVSDNDLPSCGYYSVTPDYFAAMGIRLLRGRLFTEHDDAQAVPVAIISEKLARQHFPNEDPIGKRIWATNGPKVFAEIVGVVADVKHYGVDQESQPQIYNCFYQKPFNSPAFVIRTDGPPSPAMLQGLRPAVFAVKSDQPIGTIRPMSDLVAESISRQRFSTLLLGLFAGVALLIAVVGIYGVMSYTVSQRTHEIGVRMALGAQRTSVLGLVLRQGMGVVALGLVIGLVGAFALGSVIAAQLYQTSPRDPLVLAIVPCALAGAAFLACFLPALRATRVDPQIALRAE